jgi:hypothetical protein
MTETIPQTFVVAICDSRTSAEDAVVALHREGVDMSRLSIGKNANGSDQHVQDLANAGEFLVLVHGTAEMIVHARSVLGTTGSSHVMDSANFHGWEVAAEDQHGLATD